jgi:hypothetical protein
MNWNHLKPEQGFAEIVAEFSPEALASAIQNRVFTFVPRRLTMERHRYFRQP